MAAHANIAHPKFLYILNVAIKLNEMNGMAFSKKLGRETVLLTISA